LSEKIVQLNEEIIKSELKELVRSSVEETLNGLLEAEAEKLTQAVRYERSEVRQGYRGGHYSRNLTTTSGDVQLKMPKLKGVSFETAIIERYRRRESSVEEALIEMYLAGVSVRRVEDITEALWGSKVSPSTISELNKKAYVHIEDWRNRPLQGGKYPYVLADKRKRDYCDRPYKGKRTCKQIGAKQKFNQSVEDDTYLQEFQRVYNRMYSRYYRMDAWDSDRQTNKLPEEQFRAWIAEASKARQAYKAGDISGEEMLKRLSNEEKSWKASCNFITSKRIDNLV
jgi:hypothetical protein